MAYCVFQLRSEKSHWYLILAKDVAQRIKHTYVSEPKAADQDETNGGREAVFLSAGIPIMGTLCSHLKLDPLYHLKEFYQHKKSWTDSSQERKLDVVQELLRMVHLVPEKFRQNI